MDLFITATLPENFAYLIRSFNWELTGDTVSDWDADIELRLFNHIPGQPVGTTEHVAVTQSLNIPATGNPFRIAPYNTNIPLSMFAGPIWAVHGGSITFRAACSNVAATAAAAAFIITHVEFLEYDLTQAQRYFINTPIPVLAR